MKQANYGDILAAVAPKKSALPILVTMMVKDGIGTVSDLETAAVAPVDLPDGFYRRVMKTWIKADGFEAEDYPMVPVSQIAGPLCCDLSEEQARRLVKGLPWLLKAVARDDTRRSICHVALQRVDCVIYAIAIDGKRIHRVEIGESAGDGFSILLSPKTCKVLARAWVGGGIAVEGVKTETCQWYELRVGGLRLLQRDTGHVYPNWRQVIPDARYASAVLETPGDVLGAAVSELLPYAVARGDHEGPVLVLDYAAGLLTVSVFHGDQSRAIGVVTHSEKPQTVHLSGTYLADILSGMSGLPVTVAISNDTTPLRFDCGERSAIVMPKRKG
jgi:hypothetical protein